ncbi:hypothetical protein [Streptomyces sp. NPDC059455]|uniref:hypothetical protein n=1 Tax=Streptomyces sp. NPDC059455 TaxID=3346837 RepID=UPI003696D3A5
MRAVTWQGRHDVRVETVPDPIISLSGVCGGMADSLPLEEAPRAYEMFQHKEDGAIKVLMRP